MTLYLIRYKYKLSNFSTNVTLSEKFLTTNNRRHDKGVLFFRNLTSHDRFDKQWLETSGKFCIP